MRRCLFSFFFVIALLTSVTWAVPIPVENFSFELPATGKRMGFDEIPGWNTDGFSSGSGVEPAGEPTDGDYTAFLMGTDPLIWQLTNHTILRGDIIELRVDARDAGGSSSVFLSLYYEDNGVRITVASSDVEIDEMQEFSLVFDSTDAPESAGHLLGVELGNVTGGPGDWVGVDNVRLDLLQAGKSDCAYQPSPAHGDPDAFFNATLTWTPGQYAQAHKVYLSTSFDDVNDGVALVGDNQNTNSYHHPGGLEFGATYYWRVDEVNGAPDFAVYTGPVWSFTVEPFARPIEANGISVTASSQLVNQGPEKTIDRSGLDANDLHSNNGLDMWLSDVSEPNSAWLQYEFEKPQKLHQMLVWNFNGQGLNALSGCKDVMVQTSLDGTNWTPVGGVSEFALATGTSGYAPGTIVDFDGIDARYVHLGIMSNWSGGFIDQYGLSEVQFWHIPVSARAPNPPSGATDVAVDTTLSWRPGREAIEHRVHFGADGNAVANGTAQVDIVPAATYNVGALDLGRTYYWKIDEVNDAATPSVWEGPMWSFTTEEYFVVDDFEAYMDETGEEIFATWADGYGDSSNGAQVGHDVPPYAEQAVRHNGRQSMPLYYGKGGAGHSETTRTFDPAQDWTRAGVTTLTLYVYGAADNESGQFYVKINGVAKAVAVDFTAESWQEVNVDLASLGVDLQRVISVALSIEGAASGLVFVDDIRLRL